MLAVLDLGDSPVHVSQLSLLAFQGSLQSVVALIRQPLLELISLRCQVHDLLLASNELHLQLFEEPLKVALTLLDFRG